MSIDKDFYKNLADSLQKDINGPDGVVKSEHLKYCSGCAKPEHSQRGHKADSSKPDLSLIPTDAMWEMAKAFTYGANKYGRHNFREGIEISRLLAASMRHITQFNEGEDIDEETECLHLGNAMAGLAMAIFMYKNKPEFDNRWKKIDKSTK